MANTLELPPTDPSLVHRSVPPAGQPAPGADSEAAQAVDVMQALRAATDATHKSVERRTPFFQKGFDRRLYVRWLVDMVGFYRPFELALAHSGLLAQGGWPYQSRLGLLATDLRQLGHPDLAQDALTNQRLARLPALHDPLRAAGALYVVEGSALGGQVLASRVLKALDIRLDDGGSFFQPNGPEPRIQWQQFQTLVRGLATQAQSRQTVVTAAVDTFNAFDAWLAECGWR